MSKRATTPAAYSPRYSQWAECFECLAELELNEEISTMITLYIKSAIHGSQVWHPFTLKHDCEVKHGFSTMVTRELGSVIVLQDV